MRKTVRTPFLAALLSAALAGMLAIAPMPLMAAVYKCTQNGQTTYSETPCGGVQQALKPDVVIVPATQFTGAPKQSWSVKGWLQSMGLDGKDSVVGALLIVIPLSFGAVLFMSRKSHNPLQ
jgi:Domain of unknown function (DUF4124)